MNFMIRNTDKCHLLISGQMWAELDRDTVWKSNDVKLIGITLDNNQKLDKHVSDICSKANRKLSTLRVAKFLSLSRKLNIVHLYDKINKLHERTLRIVCNDTVTSLLVKDKTFAIHHQNIQSLTIVMYKTVNNLPRGNLRDLFVRNNHSYSLRSKSKLTSPSINTLFNSQNSISYSGSVIWNSVPAELREIYSFQVFNSETKAWRPTNCPCRLCKNYKFFILFAYILIKGLSIFSSRYIQNNLGYLI